MVVPAGITVAADIILTVEITVCSRLTVTAKKNSSPIYPEALLLICCLYLCKPNSTSCIRTGLTLELECCPDSSWHESVTWAVYMLPLIPMEHLLQDDGGLPIVKSTTHPFSLQK